MRTSLKIFVSAGSLGLLLWLATPLAKPGVPVQGLPGFVAIANFDAQRRVQIERRLDKLGVSHLPSDTTGIDQDIYVRAKDARLARLALVWDSTVHWYRLKCL